MTVENLPTTCEQIKAVLEALSSADVSSTARLLAVLEAIGVSDRAELQRLTGVSDRMVRHARKQIAGNRLPETGCHSGNRLPEERKQIAEAATGCRKQVAESGIAPRARAHFETPSGLVSSKKDITHTSTVETEAARVGETELAHGVFVNCQTIRHRNFTISLGAVAMQVVRTGLSSDEIKTRCTAHALQWAAEIEGGKHPDRAVPQKIANFLSASIMGDFNRAEVQTVRLEKAKSTPAKSASANPRGTVEPGPLGRLLRQKMQAQETVQ